MIPFVQIESMESHSHRSVFFQRRNGVSTIKERSGGREVFLLLKFTFNKLVIYKILCLSKNTHIFKGVEDTKRFDRLLRRKITFNRFVNLLKLFDATLRDIFHVGFATRSDHSDLKELHSKRRTEEDWLGSQISGIHKVEELHKLFSLGKGDNAFFANKQYTLEKKLFAYMSMHGDLHGINFVKLFKDIHVPLGKLLEFLEYNGRGRPLITEEQFAQLETVCTNKLLSSTNPEHLYHRPIPLILEKIKNKNNI